MKKSTSLLFAVLMVFIVSTQINASVIDYVSSIYRLTGFTPEQTNALTYESFDATTFPPAGWTIKNRLFSVAWARATSSTNPYCLPHSGAGMIRQSSNISYPTGDLSWLITPSFDLTGGQGIVSFWIYRSLDNPGSPDSIGVWINTIADTTGANFQPLGNVSRFAPVNGWYKYTFLIPSGYNTATNYLLFGGYVFGAALMNVDDISFGVPSNMSFVNSVVTANTNPVSPNSTENQIISIPVTVTGTTNPFNISKFKLKTTGTTNPANDIRNAKLFYTGSYSTFTTIPQYASLYGNIVANPNGSFEISGNQTLIEGVNYFWLTYDVNSGAAQGNTISAVCDSVIGTGLGSISPTPAVPGGRTIVAAIPGGTYVIGPGQTSPNYPTFTAAFSDLSTRGISGPVIFNVKPAVYGTDAGVEIDSTVTLNQVTGVSNVNTITFKKKSDEPGEVWLERGGISASAVDNIITLNGASFVTFDSINVRQKDTAALNLVETGYMLKNSTKDNGSQYNTIRNSKIFLKASNVNSIGIKDSVSVPITSYSGANSYNKYQNNTILNCYSGIKSFGFSGSANPQYTNGQYNEITGNTITGFGGTSTATYGIYTNLQMFIKIAGNILISGSTSTNAVYGIFMQGNNYGNLDVYSNTVTLASGTSSQIIGGIYIQAVPGNSGSIRTHCNIQNNTLKDFNLAEANSGQFYGIYAAGGVNSTDTMNVTGNVVKNCIIGGTGANICAMFYIQGSSVNLNISNDSVYNITKIGTGTGVFYNIYQNNLGVKGISKIYNNYLANDSIKASSNVYGIYDNGNANADSCFIYGNTVNNIRTSSSAIAYGIYTNNGVNRLIYNNKVNNVKNWATGGSAHGLWINGGNFVYAYNNSISNLRTPLSTGSNAVTGIYLFGPVGPGKAYLYYNSIYLADTSSSGTYGNSGIYVADTNLVEISNNNVVNISKSGGTGVNSAVGLRLSAAATLRNAVVTSGNNNWFTGSSSLLYYDGTNSFSETQWQQMRASLNPREQGSVNVNPAFVDAYGGDLHINTATPTLLYRGALPVTSPVAITKDFDGNTRNTACPCIGFSEFNGTYATDAANPVIRYEPFGNGSSVNKTITGIVITDYSKIDTSANRPRVYYKKTTNANTINDNTSTTDGWKYTSADGTGGTPFSFTINYSLLFGGGVSQGDTIQYFIVAQDLASTPNVGINSGSFAVLPASVNLGAVNLPLSGIINRYAITSAFSNSINVGSAETIKSLTGTGGLFELINKGVVTGNITAVITSDLSETGQYGIRGWSELTSAPLNYKLRIVPDGTTERIISGRNSYTNNTAFPADSMGLIRFVGASNVTIDGGAGKYLTIRNKAIGSAINFLLGAAFDTVKNCKIESLGDQVTSRLNCSPVIFTKGTLTKGNSYNVISNNIIRERTDTTSIPLYQAIWSEGLGIYSQNTYNLIYGNEIANFTNGGIFLSSANTGNGNGWTIRKNSLYFNLPLAFISQWMPISATLGIYGGLTIDSNFIGGTAANCGGTYFYSQNPGNFYVINIGAGLDTVNTIRANVIQNIRSYPGLDGSTMRFNGIQASSGWIDIKDNIFGSTDTSKTIWYNGNMRVIEVSNGITGVVRPVTISNNTFTNIYTRKDSLIKILGGTLQRYIINVASATVPLEISGNTFSNIYSWQTPDVSANGTYFTKLSGIILSSSQKLVIKNNTFTNIGNMSTIPYVSQSRNFIYAIDNVGGMGDSSVITMNRINNVFSKNPSGANDLVVGIFNNGPASIGQSVYITNNQITMMDNSSNLGEVFGIYEPTYATFYNSFSHYYNNTVLLGGTSNSYVPSYCYYKNPSTTITAVLKNNIFYNGRTSPNASNFALGVAFYGLDKKNKSEGGSPVMGGSPTFSSNYNFYVSTSASTVCDWYGSSKSFADWKTYTGYDLNSLSDTSANIPYTTLFRVPSSGNLNIDTTQYGASFVYRRGIGNSIVPTDYNGYPRSTSGPVNIGSHEFSLNGSTDVVLFSPANGSTGNSVPVSMKWRKALFATGYRIQISSDSLFNNIVAAGSPSDTTYSFAGAIAQTRYWWRVNPVYTGLNGVYSEPWTFTTAGTQITVNLKAYLEGFWNGTAHTADTVRVYLANATSPFAYADTAKVMLNSSGEASINFSRATTGNYFIVVSHRNHLETWSRLPQSITGGTPFSYDFTTDSAKAYGFNMKKVGSVWTLYGGDANKDGSIDALDVTIFVPQYGTQGYLASDFNGDNDVTGLDVAIFVPNFGLTKIVPGITLSPVIRTKEFTLPGLDNVKKTVNVNKQNQ